MIHQHRWLIESPNGASSPGRCSCGAEKAFSNTLPPALDWLDQKPETGSKFGTNRTLEYNGWPFRAGDDHTSFDIAR